MAYDPNQARDPAGKETGGQWTGDKTVDAARKAAGLSDIKKGDEVEFVSPMADELDKNGKSIRLKVLEDLGDRVLAEAQVGMGIKPAAMYKKSDLRKVEKR